MPSALIAGPCVSEFGWELMEWQGAVRKMAQGHDKVTVCSAAGHEPLYADLNPSFIPHHVVGYRDCHRMRPGSIGNPSELTRVQHELAMDEARYRRAGYKVTRFTSIPKNPRKAVGTRRPIEQQRFVKLGDPACISEPYPLVIHARARPDSVATSGDNYPKTEWEELLRLLAAAGLSRVAAVGLRDASIVPAGAVDHRGHEIQPTMNLMAAATIVVGPSSGPMHLASLCGTPHMVWATDRHQAAIMKRNKERYESYWNPLKTPVKVLLHKPTALLPAAQLAAAVLELHASIGASYGGG